jgi:hypothetical protein
MANQHYILEFFGVDHTKDIVHMGAERRNWLAKVSTLP